MSAPWPAGAGALQDVKSVYIVVSTTRGAVVESPCPGLGSSLEVFRGIEVP